MICVTGHAGFTMIRRGTNFDASEIISNNSNLSIKIKMSTLPRVSISPLIMEFLDWAQTLK